MTIQEVVKSLIRGKMTDEERQFAISTLETFGRIKGLCDIYADDVAPDDEVYIMFLKGEVGRWESENS